MSTLPDTTAPRGWVTPARARVVWPDAPKVDAVLVSLLDVGYELCAEYAPHLAIPDPRPAEYVAPERAVHAQILLARAVWTAARAKADTMGMDDPALAIGVSVPAMSGQIKQLLRPNALPAVG